MLEFHDITVIKLYVLELHTLVAPPLKFEKKNITFMQSELINAIYKSV